MLPARAYVHAPCWPFQRIGELTTARNIDRAWSLMQPGVAAMNIARSEDLSSDVLRTGNLLVIESTATAPWVGVMMIFDEDLGAGEIEVNVLELTAIFDARLTSSGDLYESSISSGAAVQQLLNQVNARAFTGFLVPASLQGSAIEEIDLVAQSTLEALEELHDRSSNEWWPEYSVRPQRIEAKLNWGVRQGLDLSASVHLYEGWHFSRLSYRQDATRVQESVTAYGGGGAPSDRTAVTQTAGASRGSLGSYFETASAASIRAIADLPPGLRTERALFAPGTSNEAELSQEARRARERPLGAAEQFGAIVNGLADWHDLALGNLVTISAEPRLRLVNRTMRIVGVQPDEESGICELVLEVVL
jgi:hypothetical protein